MEGFKEQGAEQQGAKQMDIEGNQLMDMDNNDNDGEHETETGGVEMTDKHETGDLTASDTGHSSGRSHAVMPPLVLDSNDGKIVIRPTGDV
jgi:hypothetical protein